MDTTLRALKEFCNLILIGESACLLHDVGKLSSHFLRAKSRDCKETDRHAQVLEWDKDQISDSLKDLLATPLAFYWPENHPLPNFLEGLCLEHFISLHHGGERANHLPFNQFLRFIQACDRKSSAEDKANPSDQAKQLYMKTFRSTPFGREERINPEELDQKRLIFWQKLSQSSAQSPLLFRRKALNLAQLYLSCGLAETRRSANDLSLFHHSYSVASYFKIGLLSYLATGHLARSLEEIEQYLLVVETKDNPRGLLPMLRRFLEERYPVGNFFFQNRGQFFFLVPPQAEAFNEELKALWEKGSLPKMSWKFYPLSSEDWILPLDRSTLKVPEKKVAVVLGTPDFLRHSYLETIFSKTLEDIEENLTFAGLLKRTREILLLARWEKTRALDSQIKSLSKHLLNLQKGMSLGKLSTAKRKEYLLKRKKLSHLKTELAFLKRGSLPPFEGEDFSNYRQQLLLFVDRVFSWLHPPDPVEVAKSWNKGGTTAAIVLKYILSKGPSLSRLMAIMEESQHFFSSLERYLGKSDYFSPSCAIFEEGSRDLIEEIVTRTYRRYFAKMVGRLPCAILPAGNYRKIFILSRWQVSKRRENKKSLHLAFTNGKSWLLPRNLGNGEDDHYYLHYFIKKSKGDKRGLPLGRKILLEASQIKVGDLVETLTTKEENLL